VCNLVLYLLMEKGRFEKRGEGYPIFILGVRWIVLDFLGFSRPNRDFSMGWAA
jgi:hypothetical protein